MALASSPSAWLLQVASLSDTRIARTLPQRDFLDWTNGILQFLMLILAVAALVMFILLLFGIRQGIRRVNATVDRLALEAKPMLANANAMVGDAREMVAMVRHDVERVTDATSAITDQLLDAAETTARRVDEVNAVLDVLQDELEDTTLSAAAALRGVRVGAQALATGLVRPHRSPLRRDVPRRGGAPSAAPEDERTD
jgi:methyl-accepting chemotaxis protein